MLNSDIFIKGVVNKRLYLVKAYDYSVTEHFRQRVDDNLEHFFKMLYHLIFFGKCLINITNSVTGIKIAIIPPQDYYVDCGEIIFLKDEEYNKNELLFLGNELFDVSALGLSIVKSSIEKEHNRAL